MPLQLRTSASNRTKIWVGTQIVEKNFTKSWSWSNIVAYSGASRINCEVDSPPHGVLLTVRKWESTSSCTINSSASTWCRFQSSIDQLKPNSDRLLFALLQARAANIAAEHKPIIIVLCGNHTMMVAFERVSSRRLLIVWVRCVEIWELTCKSSRWAHCKFPVNRFKLWDSLPTGINRSSIFQTPAVVHERIIVLANTSKHRSWLTYTVCRTQSEILPAPRGAILKQGNLDAASGMLARHHRYRQTAPSVWLPAYIPNSPLDMVSSTAI